MKNLLKILPLALLLTFNVGCKKDVVEDCVCIEIYAPVCGDDGVVYDNSCFADCAGVTYTDGFCPIETDAKILDYGPVPADGCGWLIQFEVDGTLTEHHAENLPSSFEVHELEVKITYTPTLDNFTCGLMPVTYPKIELISIEQL